MTARTSRTPLPQEAERIEHVLDPSAIGTRTVGMRLLRETETADICCAASAADPWRAVLFLGAHSRRAPYLSLA